VRTGYPAHAYYLYCYTVAGTPWASNICACTYWPVPHLYLHTEHWAT
jgi:hypothetical protein